MELEGTVEGDKLVLLSKPTKMRGNPMAILRATYEKLSDKSFGYSVSLKHRDLLKS